MDLAMIETDLHGAGSARRILDQVSAMHDAIDATVASPALGMCGSESSGRRRIWR
jgi:hypothetical protein